MITISPISFCNILIKHFLSSNNKRPNCKKETQNPFSTNKLQTTRRIIPSFFNILKIWGIFLKTGFPFFFFYKNNVIINKNGGRSFLQFISSSSSILVTVASVLFVTGKAPAPATGSGFTNRESTFLGLMLN